jgi:hypothetical protein
MKATVHPGSTVSLSYRCWLRRLALVTAHQATSVPSPGRVHFGPHLVLNVRRLRRHSRKVRCSSTTLDGRNSSHRGTKPYALTRAEAQHSVGASHTFPAHQIDGTIPSSVYRVSLNMRRRNCRHPYRIGVFLS